MTAALVVCIAAVCIALGGVTIWDVLRTTRGHEPWAFVGFLLACALLMAVDAAAIIVTR